MVCFSDESAVFVVVQMYLKPTPSSVDIFLSHLFLSCTDVQQSHLLFKGVQMVITNLFNGIMNVPLSIISRGGGSMGNAVNHSTGHNLQKNIICETNTVCGGENFSSYI